MSINLTITPPPVVNIAVTESAPIALNLTQPPSINLTAYPTLIQTGGGVSETELVEIFEFGTSDRGDWCEGPLAFGTYTYANGGAVMTLSMDDGARAWLKDNGHQLATATPVLDILDNDFLFNWKGYLSALNVSDNGPYYTTSATLGFFRTHGGEDEIESFERVVGFYNNRTTNKWVAAIWRTNPQGTSTYEEFFAVETNASAVTENELQVVICNRGTRALWYVNGDLVAHADDILPVPADNGLPNTGSRMIIGAHLRDFETTSDVDIAGQMIITDMKCRRYKLSSVLTTLEYDGIAEKVLKRVWNNSGSTITKGKIVYVNGGHASDELTIALADKSSEATSTKTAGYVYADIPNNSSGYIITEGFLEGIRTNTVSGAEGSMLFLGDDGDFQSEVPVDPDHAVFVGYLVKKAGPGIGSVYVKIQNGYEINELHDVKITSPSQNQILEYDAADSLWKNAPYPAVAPFFKNYSGQRLTGLLTAATLITVSWNTNDSMRLYPVRFAYDVVISGLEMYVTSGGSATAMKMCLYNSDANGRPVGSPIEESGSISTATSGTTIAYALPANRTLYAGNTYWVGFRFQSISAFSASFRASNATPMAILHQSVTATAPNNVISLTSAYTSAAPNFTTSPWNPATQSANNSVPLVYFVVA